MIVKFKKLCPDAISPQRMSCGAAGFDLRAIRSDWDEFNSVDTYGTGLAVEIPPGHVGFLFPRSSIYKNRQSLANAVGVIDSDYRGEIIFKFYDLAPAKSNVYRDGDRVGQLVIMPVPSVDFVEVEELNDTERGAGGFGSTGA